MRGLDKPWLESREQAVQIMRAPVSLQVDGRSSSSPEVEDRVKVTSPMLVRVPRTFCAPAQHQKGPPRAESSRLNSRLTRNRPSALYG